MADTTIAIVDDHPLLMEGVAAVLGRRPGLSVVGTGSSAADILPLATAHQLDAIVVDLNMPGDTFLAIKDLRAAVPQTRIVVFTASTNTEHAIRALDAGAGAYVLKGSPAADLAEAIEATGRGEIYITPAFAAKVISALQSKALEKRSAEAARLSVREEQIVRLLLCGKQNREIARELALSEKTVKGYMTNLMTKLHARNRLEVVIAAQRLHVGGRGVSPGDTANRPDSA
ncbi:MAG TPA: response regulator transcription factor [Bosea sp. (in: a-proteobacteria)]|jgi:DNA-binding NarL/FixJ family response regulator|uniref:response regulator transcription factor n=1 Tax=Bosea sp. (in: a-proteobacteria) TaxID=1871050 RepID=UPI002E13F96D|nr:response regulator transcription factor [Bosea sp. (in: a-proteobacteria)]